MKKYPEKLEKYDGDFINLFSFFNKKYPFQFFIGGRGCGKTYSGIRGMMEFANKPLYLRRSPTELANLVDTKTRPAIGNPFKAYYPGKLSTLCFYGDSDKHADIVEWETDENGKRIYGEESRGYASSLYALQKRSINLEDVDFIFFDEFIRKENDRRTIKDEFKAFCDMCETINRNREFDGKSDPAFVFCASNSNSIYNDIFAGFGIVSAVEKELRKSGNGTCDLFLPDRGIAVHVLKNADSFTMKKAKTAIMKACKGTSYYDFALKNEFAFDDFTNVEERNIKGYLPLFRYDNFTGYKQKGSNIIYLSFIPAHCEKFTSLDADKTRFYSRWGNILRDAYIDNRLYYQSFDIKKRILTVLFE